MQIYLILSIFKFPALVLASPRYLPPSILPFDVGELERRGPQSHSPFDYRQEAIYGSAYVIVVEKLRFQQRC